MKLKPAAPASPFVLFPRPKLVRFREGNSHKPALELAYYGYVEWLSRGCDPSSGALAGVEEWTAVGNDWFTERIGISKEALAHDLHYTLPYVERVPLAPVRKAQLHFYSVSGQHLRVFPDQQPPVPASNGAALPTSDSVDAMRYALGTQAFRFLPPGPPTTFGPPVFTEPKCPRCGGTQKDPEHEGGCGLCLGDLFAP